MSILKKIIKYLYKTKYLCYYDAVPNARLFGTPADCLVLGENLIKEKVKWQRLIQSTNLLPKKATQVV